MNDAPIQRRSLSRPVRALLWVLRAYVIVAVPLVVYTFVHTLKP